MSNNAVLQSDTWLMPLEVKAGLCLAGRPVTEFAEAYCLLDHGLHPRDPGLEFRV